MTDCLYKVKHQGLIYKIRQWPGTFSQIVHLKNSNFNIVPYSYKFNCHSLDCGFKHVGKNNGYLDNHCSSKNYNSRVVMCGQRPIGQFMSFYIGLSDKQKAYIPTGFFLSTSPSNRSMGRSGSATMVTSDNSPEITAAERLVLFRGCEQ